MENEKMELTPANLTDSGICPTCYDREHDYILYGDPRPKTIYENDLFECVLVGAPRSVGHAIIASKEHYKDMMEIPDKLNTEIFIFAKLAMNVLKEVYNCESVYLCTMCDGPMNHFHLQLIPRYDFEKRGSNNFVKERKNYVHDQEIINKLRKRIMEELEK